MDGRCHVDMNPSAGEIEAQVSVDEQSGAGRLRVAPVSHRVLHVSHGRRKLGEMELGAVDQWEGEVAGYPAGSRGLGLPLGVVGQVSRVVTARGNPLRTGQRAHVQDDAGSEVLVGKHHAVRNDQAPLSVRVVDLHRPARVQSVDVVRPRGAVAHRVLGQAEHSVEVFLESLLDGGVERSQDAGSSATVTFHAGHGRLALKQNAFFNQNKYFLPGR